MLMHSFRQVVALGGFSRAALALGVAPTTLSKQVRALEAHLGTALIQRTTRRMALTDAGRDYYDECCRLLDGIESLEHGVRQRSGEIHGRLRVNAPVSFSLVVLVPLIARFMADYPAIALDLVMDDRLLDIVGEGFDVAIRLRGTLDDSTLVARRLATLDQILCASPGYLEQAGHPATPGDLAHHALLAYSHAQSPAMWDFHHVDERVSIRVGVPRIRINNSSALRELLVAGMGIGSLPAFLADPELANGRLQRVLPQYSLPQRHVHAMHPGNRHMPPKVRAFLDFLSGHLPASMRAIADQPAQHS